MSDLTEFFLGAPRWAVQLELIEISHPNFTKTYYICRNARDGVTVTLETSETKFFEYKPIKVTKSGASDDLESGIQISFGDLGETLPTEIDRIEKADNFKTYPKCIYRIYRSTDLSAPMIGPYEFEIKNVTGNREGATLNAKAPGLNVSKTGALYRIDRFVMLRGFL